MADTNKTQADDAPPKRFCPQCGAPLSPGLTACWLCFSKSKADQGPSEAVEAQNAPAIRGEATVAGGGFSLASLLMFVTLICVVVGTITIAPGLGVPLGIISFVMWMRTVSVVKYREATHKPMSTPEIVVMFLRSVVFALVILVLVGVAAVAALAAACFGLFSMGGGGSDMGSAFAVAVAILVGSVIAIVAAYRFSRNQWQRDHGRDPSSER